MIKKRIALTTLSIGGTTRAFPVAQPTGVRPSTFPVSRISADRPVNSRHVRSY